MTTRGPWVALCLGLVTVAATPTAVRADDTPACIRFWGETRYGAMAYNHIVHVANACDRDADCAVSTDVNPTAQSVAVESKSEVEVLTFMGSPARAFKPRVKCTLRSP